MPETVAEILNAYRTGDATPADIVARSFARLRAHDDPAMFISLREEKDVIAEAQALARRRRQNAAALRHSGRGEGQYRRRRPADHRRLSGFSLSPKQGRHRGGAAARSGRAHSRQDQSRSVRDRARRRALALRHRRAICSTTSSFPADRAPARRSPSAPASCRWRSAPIPRDRAACPPPTVTLSGLKPSLGLGFDRWRRSGLPHARLRLGLRADRRRCDDGAQRRSPGPTTPIRIRGRAPCGAVGAVAGRVRLGVPSRRPAPVLRRSESRPPPMTRLWPSLPTLGADLSRWIWSRSTKRRGCFTRAHGSPSATSPPKI